MCEGVLRVQLDNALADGDRLVHGAGLHVGHGQAVQGIGPFRPFVKGLGVGRDGLGEFVLAKEAHGLDVVSVG